MATPQWATPDRLEALAKLQQLRCSLGEEHCPVVEAFTAEVVRRLGPPDGNLAWIMRAALITPDVLKSFSPFFNNALPHLAFWLSKEWVRLWKAEDSQERAIALKREQRRLHALLQIRKRGPFDTIAREEYLANRPLWRIEAAGVGAFSFKRMVKVRIPSLEQEIFVSLAGLAKATGLKKKKLLRFKKGAIPRELEERVYQIAKEAVSRELAR